MLQNVLRTDTIKALDNSRIVVGKIAASCSSIHQPSDVSTLFRDVKTRLRHWHESGIVHELPELSSNIDTVLTEFVQETNNRLSTELKTKIIRGCVDIAAAMQSMHVSKKVIDGFTDCGQYPLSFERIMSRCFQKIPVKDMVLLEKASEEDVNYFKEHGHIPDRHLSKFLSLANFTEEPSQRDGRPLQNQRAIILNNRHVIDMYLQGRGVSESAGQAYREAKSPKQRKQIATAIKAVTKERNLEASKAAAAETKEAEKKRKASMSPEEKAMEAESKRVAKEEKQLKKKQELDEHIAYLRSLNVNV